MTPDGKACEQLIITALNNYSLPCTNNAVRLLEMIAAHESGGFTYSRQLSGPALGLFQMEPRTFRDVCDYVRRKQLSLAAEVPCSPYRLVFDPPFAAGMARVFFLRFPEPIPEAQNITGLFLCTPNDSGTQNWAKRHRNNTPTPGRSILHE